MTTDYAKLDFHTARHRERYRRRVLSRPDSLVCQECHGRGGRLGGPDYVGPWETCGWCEGTGLVTPWMRGYWLRCKKLETRERHNRRDK